MTYDGNDFYCDIAIPRREAITVEYESEHVLAFHHTKPYWPVHIVVVPKQHVDSFLDLDIGEPVHQELLQTVQVLAKQVQEEHGAARVLTNLGEYQDSKHLHFHVCSGELLR